MGHFIVFSFFQSLKVLELREFWLWVPWHSRDFVYLLVSTQNKAVSEVHSMSNNCPGSILSYWSFTSHLFPLYVEFEVWNKFNYQLISPHDFFSLNWKRAFVGCCFLQAWQCTLLVWKLSSFKMHYFIMLCAFSCFEFSSFVFMIVLTTKLFHSMCNHWIEEAFIC